MYKKRAPEAIIAEEMPDFWNRLDADERTLVASRFQVQSYKKNGLIYNEGETPTYLMCLLRGKVKIFKDGVGGRSQIIRLIKPVQYFGYRAFFANEPYVTAASAFEPATLGFIPMTVVDELVRRNNRIAYFFIQELSVDLGVSDARTVNLTQKHIRGRLAESLIFLKESYGLEEDGATIIIYMAREDLANLSNMTTSNAIRTLSGFSNEQLIVVDGRRIKILDEEQLRKISKFG